MPKEGRVNADSFDRSAAEEDSQNPQLTEFDHFLVEAEIAAHDNKAKTLEEKTYCRNISLQQEALRYHRENPSKHAELDRLLQKRCGQDLDQEVYNSLKDHTKALYRERPGFPIEELTDPSENAICVKLIRIFALRTGAVKEKS